MGPIGCPETSVRIYHKSLFDNPEECSCGAVKMFWAVNAADTGRIGRSKTYCYIGTAFCKVEFGGKSEETRLKKASNLLIADIKVAAPLFYRVL